MSKDVHHPTDVDVILIGSAEAPLRVETINAIAERLRDFDRKLNLTAVVGPIAYQQAELPVSVFRELGSAIAAGHSHRVMVLDQSLPLSGSLLQRLFIESVEVPELFRATGGEAQVSWLELWRKVTWFICRLITGGRSVRWMPSALSLPRRYVEKDLLDGSRNIAEATMLLTAEGVPLRESTFAPANGESIALPRFGSAIGELLSQFRFWWQVLKFPGGADDVHASPTRTEAATTRAGVRNWLPSIGLLLLAGLMLLRGTNYPLFEPDESRNAQLALNILHTGEWVSLRLGEEPYWDKPPLAAWLTAASYRIFGVSEFSTRLPVNLAALFTVMVTYGFGVRLLGKRIAWISALMLILSAGFVACGRYVTMDSLLTLLATTTLFAAHLATRGPKFVAGWWFVSAVAGGLGLLAKGPVIVALTLPVLITHHLLTGNRTLLDWPRWAGYVAVVGLISLPWYLAMGLVFPEFIPYFFWKHHVMRFSEAFNHHEPWWYYGPVLFLILFPSSFLLPSLVRWLWTNTAGFRRSRTPSMGLLTLSATWVILLFSLSEAKLPTYILPALPSLCLLTGSMLERRALGRMHGAIRSSWLDRVPVHASRTLLALIAIGVALVLIVNGSKGVLVWGEAVGCIVLGVYLTRLCHGKDAAQRRSWGAVAALAGMTMIVLFQQAIPVVSEHRSIYVAARQLRSDPVLGRLPVAFFEHEDYGAGFWLSGENVVVFDDDDRHKMTAFLEEKRKVLIVSREEDVEILTRTLKWPLAVTPVEGTRRLYLCSERDSKTQQPQTASRIWSDLQLLRR